MCPFAASAKLTLLAGAVGPVPNGGETGAVAEHAADLFVSVAQSYTHVQIHF